MWCSLKWPKLQWPVVTCCVKLLHAFQDCMWYRALFKAELYKTQPTSIYYMWGSESQKWRRWLWLLLFVGYLFFGVFMCSVYPNNCEEAWLGLRGKCGHSSVVLPYVCTYLTSWFFFSLYFSDVTGATLCTAVKKLISAVLNKFLNFCVPSVELCTRCRFGH